jgi:hypothetical protein
MMVKFIELDNGSVINVNGIVVLEEVRPVIAAPPLRTTRKRSQTRSAKQSAPTYRLRMCGVGNTSFGLFGSSYSSGMSISLSGVKEFNRIKKMLLAQET